MATTNPIVDIDAKAAIGGPALRPRAGGNGRHHGNMPDMFPAVLADFKLLENPAPEALAALDVAEKPIGSEGEPDAGDKEEASPDEEAAPHSVVSYEVKQYLQNLAATVPMQTGREVAGIVREAVDELLSTLASTHAARAGGTSADGESAGDMPEDVENSDAPGTAQQKLANSQGPGDRKSVEYQSPLGFPGFSVSQDTGFAAELSGGGSIKNPQSLRGLRAGDGILNPQDLSGFPAGDGILNPQDLSGIPAGNNLKNLQIQANPRQVKSTNPAEWDGKNVSPPPDMPSGELPKPEILSDLKEVRQTKSAGVEVRVIKVETSFPPTVSPAFIQQFSKAITDTLDGPVKGAALVAATPVTDPRPDVVRSIQIQLHPEDLGKIKVAMRLRGEELRLQIEVTSKKVETLLQNDHQVLKDLLSQSGYDIKDASISITLTPADPLPPQRGTATNEPSAGSLVGQGSRQHPGTGEEPQNPFQKARGSHAFAAEFESDQGTRSPAAGPRRGSGVFV